MSSMDEFDAADMDGGGDEPTSETPCFDALFARYDVGNSCFGTEHLSALLLDMGFNCAPRVLDQALDEMDPNATGEIAKFSFLEWFEANADAIDLPSATSAPSTSRGSGTARSYPGSPRGLPGMMNGEDEDDDDFNNADTPSAIANRDNAARTVSQLTSEMVNAKAMRKRTDEDVQVLTNRLEHLRAEAAKAQKRTEEANRRASEIEAIKKRNADHQRSRQRAEQQMRSEIQQTHQANQLALSTSRARRHRSQHEIMTQRSQVVQQTRAERQAHLQRIQKARHNEQRELAERSKEIRASERHAAQRREHLRVQHERDLMRQTRARLAQEHERRLRSEKLIARMEREEAELIEKLRLSHEMQRTALEHLEFVIQDGNDG